MNTQQTTPMKFDPVDGKEWAVGMLASTYRPQSEGRHWFFNPWTGSPRAPEDIASDPRGVLIVPPGGALRAAPAPDDVNHPAHYTGGKVECIEAIEAALTPDEYRGYLKGNILKYTWRERTKEGDKAMAKARWYLERLLGKGGAT